MPLPNHQVIPDGWSQHHRPTADGQMTAVGTITIPAGSSTVTFNETTGRAVQPAGTVIYGPGIGSGYRDGRMRVQRLLPGQVPTAAITGDREIILRQYRVSFPIDGPTVPVPIGAIVQLLDCEDPDAIGRPLHVRGVQVGSLVWQRDLFCEDPGPTSR